jgi:CcmD family protein
VDALRIFFEQYAYYIVLAVTLAVWSGLFFYILSIDKKLKKLEKE